MKNLQYFNYFGSMITNVTRSTHKCTARFSRPKATLNKTFFHLQIGLNFNEGTTEMLHVEYSFVWFWTLQLIRNIFEVLRCVGEGWSLIGLIVWEMKKYCTGSRRKGIFYIQQKRSYLALSHLAQQLSSKAAVEGKTQDLKEMRRHW